MLVSSQMTRDETCLPTAPYLEIEAVLEGGRFSILPARGRGDLSAVFASWVLLRVLAREEPARGAKARGIERTKQRWRANAARSGSPINKLQDSLCCRDLAIASCIHLCTPTLPALTIIYPSISLRIAMHASFLINAYFIVVHRPFRGRSGEIVFEIRKSPCNQLDPALGRDAGARRRPRQVCLRLSARGPTATRGHQYWCPLLQ